MFNIEEKNIKDIKKAFKNNELTSEGLVLTLLDRISNIDQGEIKFNSILEVNPDALTEAVKCDYERKKGLNKGFLHGIPVLLKDNINTKGKMHTTAGSIALKDNFASYDAKIVERLKQEGAIILGKTNLTEFANFMAYNMRNGFSSLGREVLCPYNIDTDPSGSSAGSAVSVALNLAPLAIGTETGGSIMSPSMKNGIVGIKPTIGLVSRTGIIPISSTLDTAGPMAKNVYDAALLLSALRCNDINDPITTAKDDYTEDYTQYLFNTDVKDLKIGVCFDNIDKLSQKRQDKAYEIIKVLKENKIKVIENIKVPTPSKIVEIMIYEFKRLINKYLSECNNIPVKTLEDIINFNIKNSEIALKYGQEMLENVQNISSGRLNEKKYFDALLERELMTKDLEHIFTKNNFDIIYFVNYTSLGPMCGFPTITIPIGLDEENIPIGMYMLANKNREDLMINAASHIEKIVGNRINPLKK